jgi:MerR family transcriptional regulator, light-induced transcriptional regulator
MNDRVTQPKLALSIAAVERDTGLLKDTLRVWERRYGFPTPDRDQFGERSYPLDQVEKLRIVRRLIDAGHRPGRIMGMDVNQLQLLANEVTAAPRSLAEAQQEHTNLQSFIDLIKAHKVEELRRSLGQVLMRQGLESFVVEVAAPLSRMVGDAWARGFLEIFEEHLYTESMQIILRNAIGNAPSPARGPRVLLTTFPQESHGLGLLMVEALLVLEGARCISLGTMTPVWDIVLASTSQNVDIVALSFSAALNPNIILEGLAELHEKLPPTVEIWAGGGGCPILLRKPPKGVLVIADLAAIKSSVADWRQRFASI